MPQLEDPIARGHKSSTSLATITLSVTPEFLETIERMSHDSGLTLDVVFTRALGLYGAALNAIAEGKHIGYSVSSDKLDVEFTGFLGTGEL